MHVLIENNVKLYNYLNTKDLYLVDIIKGIIYSIKKEYLNAMMGNSKKIKLLQGGNPRLEDFQVRFFEPTLEQLTEKLVSYTGGRRYVIK